MKAQSVVSEKQKNMIEELNLYYVLLVKELVRDSLDKAKLVTGLTSETLKLIESIPTSRLIEVSKFPLLLSGVQNNIDLLKSVQDAVPLEKKKVSIIKHLTQLAA